MSRMVIATAGDPNYAPHIAAMLESLFSHNKAVEFEVHVMHRDQSGFEPPAQLMGWVKEQGHTAKPLPVPVSALEGYPVSEQYPVEIWFRLLLPQLLPEEDKVLWLDGDIYVNGNVEALWQLDLSEKALAAVPNAMLPREADHPEVLGLARPSAYFNSGVLMIDQRAFARIASLDDIRRVYEQHAEHIIYPDQDVLNLLFNAGYEVLPMRWNVISSAFFNCRENVAVHGMTAFREAMQQPVIVHFTGGSAAKPWRHNCSHPWRRAYLESRERAGWGTPNYKDATWTSVILRHLPIRWRVAIRALRRFKLEELWQLSLLGLK